MPILDLLASITGEKPATSSPNPPPRPSVVVPKRKAEDELRSGGAKTARTDSPADKTSQPSSNSSRPSPRPAERTLGPSIDKPSKPQVSLSRPASNDRLKPTSLAVSSTAKAPATGTKPLPSRPAVNRPSPTDSGPPKKRSYAEIMARAKANSEQRESLGKIHHKTVERSLTMKERKDLKAEEARKARVAARKGTSGRPGATTALPRDIPKASGPRERVPPPSGSAPSRKSAPVEEKKVKKAALATTGYTGTARPRPGASTLAKPATSRPSSDTRARDRSRYGGSGSRNRYEEEDEDLDDFIEYDDEEEPPEGYGNGRGGGYNRYDSYDEESDMEAGLSDIEDEEQLADRQARREDLEQDALERKLKLEKEERKKRLMQGSKARAGGR